LARKELSGRGARPCLDLVSLSEFLKAFEGFDIGVIRDGHDE